MGLLALFAGKPECGEAVLLIARERATGWAAVVCVAIVLTNVLDPSSISRGAHAQRKRERRPIGRASRRRIRRFLLVADGVNPRGRRQHR